VPGSGKTLAGLNIVHNHSMHEGDLGVFLSGNGPLVRVLTEALARDHAHSTNLSLKEARRKVSTFVQNVHRFIDHYYSAGTEVPPDKVVIFDEAQRAWDARQSLRKFRRPHSESELMLEIMDRHPDWAVIVALIGNGQEINSGEAGLSEWGRTLLNGYRHWKVMVSPELHLQNDETSDGLFSEPSTGLSVNTIPDLHLKVSLRSYRAEALSQFVDHLLSLHSERAQGVMS
jgi:hypothetical protein